VLEVRQILKDQKQLEEEYAKLKDTVKKYRQGNEASDFTIKLEDLLDITHISDDLSQRDTALDLKSRELFDLVSPSNIFVSQEFFNAWIEVHETMAVRWDYQKDRIEVRELAGNPAI
jgi:hypothetical protein